jgi:hypothetical protein
MAAGWWCWNISNSCAFAFVPLSVTTPAIARQLAPTLPLYASSLSEDLFRQVSFRIPREDVTPILRFGGKGNDNDEKIINAFGIWCLTVTMVTGAAWVAAMSILNWINQQFPAWDPHRAIYDRTGKIWSKTYLRLTQSFPTQSGNVEALHEGHGACLYVANHASWLDIPMLCTVLDPVFKFIAKGELRTVPCIGQQLTGVRTCI